MNGNVIYCQAHSQTEHLGAITQLKSLIACSLPDCTSRHDASITCSMKRCPRCDGAHVTKRGRDQKGRQRYLCHECHRSFNETTGSPLSATNLPLETWLIFADCHMGACSLRSTADMCRVSVNTALFMRHRLNRLIAEAIMGGLQDASQCIGRSADEGHAEQQSLSISAIPDRNKNSTVRCWFSIDSGPLISANEASESLAQKLSAWIVCDLQHGTAPWSELGYRSFICPFRGVAVKWESGYRWWHAWTLYHPLLARFELFARLVVKRLEALAEDNRAVKYNLSLEAFTKAWNSQMEASTEN